MRLCTNNKGFTLVEILVVLALTMMVMGLVFGPLIQTFKITSRTETIIRAQDNARQALAQITSDLSNAMYVYDNTRDPINFPVLDAMGNVVNPPPQVLYAKVDLVLPRMRGYCPIDTLHTPGGIQRGQDAAPTCPVCGEQLELKPVEPLIPDTMIVRYFLGLKDPRNPVDSTAPNYAPYYNGYNYKLAEADQVDNTYVLYRAEFNPFDSRLFPNANQANFNANLSDPNFFYNNLPNGRPGGETYAMAWRKISRPVVTLNDIDLITIEFDAGGNPIVTPTVKFAPTAVYNDPLVPTTGADDEPDRGDAPPTMYKASYGHWVLPYKVILDSDAAPGVIYETRPGLGLTSWDPPTDMCIYRTEGVTSSEPVFVFNITHYLNTRDASPYGIAEMWPPNIADREKAFTVDTVKGAVNCAFPNCYQVYCDDLNSTVPASVGGYMTLSQMTDSTVVNADTLGRTVINTPPASGLDPRVLGNATVVPGSVKVIAPDVLQPQLGSLVPYSRSAFLTQDPGMNQFSVDIRDDSSLGAAAIYFNMPHPANPSPQRVFPTPGTNDVLVYYEVQNNRKGDLLRANYVTKDLMTIILGIRIYDSNSGKVQAVQLTNKMRLKNIAE